MKSSVETLSPTRVKLTVEVPFDELSDNVAGAYKRIAAQVTVPGFRKGKVPARIIDQRFGRGVVLEEAINEALPRVYDDAVKEAGLVPLGQPKVDVDTIDDGKPLSFTAEIDVLPAFELPDYDGIAVRVEDATVTDAQVDEQLDELRKRFGTAVPVERGALIGDVLLVDVTGTKDDEKLVEYSATALSYELGTGGLIPGADDELLGAAAGDKRTIGFTPEDGPYAGQEVQIEIAVQGVRERSLPAADDEFAQLASEFDTLDELRADIRARLEKMGLVEQGYAAREKVLDELLERTDLPIPDGVVQAQVEEHFAEEGGGHDHGGEDHDTDAHRGEIEANARKALKSQFVLDKVADAEQISVGQGELTQWLVTQASQYGMSPDQFADALVQAGQVQTAVADVRRSKALATVLRKAAIADASGNAVNLAELDQVTEEVAEELEELEELEAEAEEIEMLAAEAEILEEVVEEVVAEVQAAASREQRGE